MIVSFQKTGDFDMRNRPVVAVDFDNTLFDFNQHFTQFHNQEYGTDVTCEMITSHAEFYNAFGCEREEMAKRVAHFDQVSDYLALPPAIGAIEAISLLSQMYDLHIVTARQEHGRALLTPYVETFFGVGMFEGIHFTNAFSTDPTCPDKPRTKAEACQEIRAVVLIDDAPEHAASVASSGLPVLLVHQPWNISFAHPNVHRMRSWNEAMTLLKPLFAP